jgi:hypothetical protein
MACKVAAIMGLVGSDCCQFCCHDGGQHLPRMDSPGMSAQRTDRGGRSWTMCPLLWIRGLGAEAAEAEGAKLWPGSGPGMAPEL